MGFVLRRRDVLVHDGRVLDEVGVDRRHKHADSFGQGRDGEQVLVAEQAFLDRNPFRFEIGGPIDHVGNGANFLAKSVVQLASYIIHGNLQRVFPSFCTRVAPFVNTNCHAQRGRGSWLACR